MLKIKPKNTQMLLTKGSNNFFTCVKKSMIM